jgi:hypothetical protein
MKDRLVIVVICSLSKKAQLRRSICLSPTRAAAYPEAFNNLRMSHPKRAVLNPFDLAEAKQNKLSLAITLSSPID